MKSKIRQVIIMDKKVLLTLLTSALFIAVLPSKASASTCNVYVVFDKNDG